MENLSPLIMKPAVKDYIWGGDKLIKEWNKNNDSGRIAECWELSAFVGSESVVTNGEFAGKTLADLFKNERWLFGNAYKDRETFPVLIKLIDASGDLSVQVHPDDEYAATVEHQSGKNEMWYVADATDNASIYMGFKRDVSREEVACAIKNNSLQELLNRVPVKQGDAVFIEAGTVHAILAGVTIIEIQQSSSVTYRLYDYRRIDKYGKPRELHVEKGLDVLNYKAVEKGKVSARVFEEKDGYSVRQLPENRFFSVKEYKLGHVSLYNEDRFLSFTVYEGNGEVNGVKVKKGDTVFIPAGLRSEINGELSIIVSETF